jgi:hypothetical protein
LKIKQFLPRVLKVYLIPLLAVRHIFQISDAPVINDNFKSACYPSRGCKYSSGIGMPLRSGVLAGTAVTRQSMAWD